MNFDRICIKAFSAFLLLLTFSSVAFADGDPDIDAQLAPLPSNPAIPADNASSASVYPSEMDDKQKLGYQLFYDTKLSGNKTVSCASCHQPDAGWANHEPLSRGYDGAAHWRNSQSIVNSGYYSKNMWGGAVPNLEAQAEQAAKSAIGCNGNTDIIESRLLLTASYRDQWKSVYGHGVPLINDVWRAIAAFERYVSQPDTPFDKFIQGDKDAISASARNGYTLFTGKANCLECHNGPLLSDEKYYNLAVPNPPQFAQSALHQITFRYQQYTQGVGENVYRNVKRDLGLFYREKTIKHKMMFRTPSLRYLKYTAPYMHNGVFATLMDVVDFYDAGGGEDKDDPYRTKTGIIAPLSLTPEEKADLVEFILSMSGDEIILDAPDIPEMGVFGNGKAYK